MMTFLVDLFMAETLNTLKLFERDIMSSFLTHEAKKVQGSLEARMLKLEEK